MDQHEQPLYAFLLALSGSTQLAADCAQDTFIRAYEQLCKRKLVTRAWLFRVARNRTVDAFRQQEREKRKAHALRDMRGEHKIDESYSESARCALLQLSVEDRELLYLWAVDRWTGEEIAALLGIRTDAVYMRLSRARSRFKDAYGALS